MKKRSLVKRIMKTILEFLVAGVFGLFFAWIIVIGYSTEYKPNMTASEIQKQQEILERRNK